MSVSISLLLNNYSSLENLAHDISEIMNIELTEERSDNERYFYNYLNNGSYFSLGYQDYLENDNDIDFESFKYIVSIYLNKIEKNEIQIDNFSSLLNNVFDKLKFRNRKKIIGLIIYDNQAILAELN